MFHFAVAIFAAVALVVFPVGLWERGVSGWAIGVAEAALLAAFLAIDWVTSRGQITPTPLRVYVTLLAALALAFIVIYVLSLLGPVPVLGGGAALLVLMVTLMTLRRPHTREARETAGLCPGCGYDLRATEDRCPECNEPVPPSITRRKRAAEALRETAADR
jgi:hypothetical protein